MLQIRLLGQFDVRLDGKRIVISSRAGQSLLAYLAMTAGTPHRREKMAGTLWPDSSEENARKNLRQELWRIRKAIPTQNLPEADDYLIADEYTLTFNRESDYWLDVSLLEKSDADIQSLTSSLSLYQGELLPGFYDDWVVLERERLQTLFESKMEQLVENLVESERWTAVQEQCERWLALGFVSESAYRALMLSYNARGDMAKVSSIYQRCAEDLQDHFGVQPSAETHALFNGLLKGAKVPRRILPAQPSGTVTFLFTDIQGSTRLLDKLGDQYAISLAEHHGILRAAIQKWKGMEMDTQGDAVFVTFTRALDALQCAAEAQRELAKHTWLQDEPIRVRMGLHTGEPLIASTGYAGMEVHRAARIGDAGHGGQILLSQTTRDLVIHDLPLGISIKDLGEHRFKDMKYPTPIYQLVIEGSQTDFPPLKTKFTGSEAPTPGDPPFKGLQYFEEKDADLFFGREQLTAKLLQRLQDTQFLSVIIGASGSGKSSLVRAGLIPAIKNSHSILDRSKGDRDWKIHMITPTAHPLESLATELTRDFDSVAVTARLIDDLVQEPRSLALFLARHNSDCHTVLLVDQFEELFTLCRDEFEREAFIDNLLNLVSPDHSNVTLIITLRADFYAHLAQYPELRDAVAQQQEYIGPMTTEDLRRAIEEPARHAHWEFEPGLVDLILRDVGDEPGALPLLSHALLETWKRRAAHTLTLKGYADAGGVHGAIAHTAETVYQNLSPEEQTIARDIFLRLTELGEGTEDTRRRASFEELMSHAENRDDVRNVLNKLADARLITLGEDTAEVAHEALIREWPTLREWLNQDREGLRLHRHITEAAYEWELLGRDAGALYRGTHMAQAREWAALHPKSLNTGENAFLEASNQLEQNEMAEREAQQRREIEAAQKLADAERSRAEEQTHSANRLRLRNRVITTVGLIAIVLAALAGLFGMQSSRNLSAAHSAEVEAVQQKETAQNNFKTAERSRLAALAFNTFYGKQSSEVTALLALRSLLHYGYSPEADGVLGQALGRGFTRAKVGPLGPVFDVSFLPDGQRFLTASYGGWVRIWDVKTGSQINAFGEDNGLFRAALSPDGSKVLTGGDHGVALLWDTATGKQLKRFQGHMDGITSVAFSPDGKTVASASLDKTARLWSVRTGQELQRFDGGDKLETVAFSPDGKYLLTGGDDKVARLWDLQTGVQLRQFEGHTDGIYHVTFSPDSKWIATSSADNTTQIWEIETGKNLLRLEHTADVTMSVFSPDGRFILTGDADAVAHLWDAKTGVELKQWVGHGSYIWCVAFSPDSKMILTGSEDGSARLWDNEPDRGSRLVLGNWPDLIQDFDLSPDEQFIIAGGLTPPAQLIDVHTGQVRLKFVNKEKFADDEAILGVDISFDGKWALTGGHDKVARLWDMQTGNEVRQFVGHQGWINDLKFSPDGQYIATSGNFPDSTIRLWETQSGKEIHRLTHGNSALRIAFSSDGKYLAAGMADSSVWVWDTRTWTMIHELEGHTSRVFDIAFSPDSQHLVTGSNDNTARLWDVVTGLEVHRFTGHTDLVSSVSFSHDGRYIATSSFDKTSRIWDVNTGQEVRRLVDNPGPVSVVRFTYDDQSLYIANFNSTTLLGSIREWKINLDAVITKACAALPRDFTPDERQLYNLADDSPTCPNP